MIAYIKGQLADVAQDSIVVDVAGIGYQIYVSGQVLERLPPVGREIKVHTYLQVREDAMTLFGFLTKDDLGIFKLMLGVGGIGPKGALAVLSVMTTENLRFAILGDDAKAIAKTPGIGIKTAQRLILELKDKVSVEDILSGQSDEMQTQSLMENSSMPDAASVKEEAVLALIALGYSSSEALKALTGIEITQEMDAEALLKQALKKMALV